MNTSSYLQVKVSRLLIALLLAAGLGTISARSLGGGAVPVAQYKTEVVVALSAETTAKVGQAIQQSAAAGWRFASQSAVYRPDTGQAIYVLVFEK